MSLTGRKRFLSDLSELQAVSKRGWELHGVQIKGLRSGDDEGSVEFTLIYDGDPISKPLLLITAYDQQDDAHETVSEVLENVSSSSAKPLKDTISRLVKSISSALGLCEDDDEMEEAEDDSDDDDGHASLDGEGMEIFQHKDVAHQMAALKRDFLEIVAADWKPGLMSTPPNALAAWDRRLLLPDQHLTLIISGFRGSYPPLSETGQVASGFAKIRFHVGLSDGKPSRDVVEATTRDYGLKEDERFVPEPEPAPPEFDEDDPDTWDIQEKEPTPELEPVHEPGRFDKFSLSTSLNSLLNDSLIPLIQLRVKFGIGWAGAEMLLAHHTEKQISPEMAYEYLAGHIQAVDLEERAIAHLPLDPLFRPKGAGITSINLPLVAFSYLLRRVLLCPRFCLVCHQRIQTDFVAIKPYVCEKGLCAYQFYALSFGTSIEYDIVHNPAVVDLLVSFAYASALEGQLKEELPVGIGLRVPKPSRTVGDRTFQNYMSTATQVAAFEGEPEADGLYDFDRLPIASQRGAIVDMLSKIPKVSEMRQYLLRITPASKARGRQTIRNMNDDTPAAAWTLLRWCVASCTAYIEELCTPSERVQGIETNAMYHQFRFSVGSPQAEAKFQAAVQTAMSTNSNAKKYPTLYAWHGSPLMNWHSIIRQGLHFKDIAHGRAYGNGVYFAKDGNISMSYSRAATSRWKNSELAPSTALAIAEIVNLPEKFVSTNPYFVVPEVTWISTRYLLVQSSAIQQTLKEEDSTMAIKTLTIDPKNGFVLNNKPIGIPLRIDQLDLVMQKNRKEYKEKSYDEEDLAVFKFEDNAEPPRPPPPADDWKHDPSWVEQTDYQLLSAPTQASPMSTMHLQKEFKYMMEEQRKAKSLRELGYFISPEVMGDNLFQWIVELHSFDKDLPLARDMASKKVNSLLFEIRFPPNFPHSPPFFRLIKPRLLPFLQGGGGHVTAGGSICMDLLVQDGWLPSYNIAAVLLQIRMAISSTEPRPARLAPGDDWKRAYGVHEAFEGIVLMFTVYLLRINNLQVSIERQRLMGGEYLKEPGIYYADSRAAIHRYIVPPLSRLLLDAEGGHKFALGVLKGGLGPRDQGLDDEILQVELWDKKLANPVGLAAGFDKDGEAVNSLFDLGFSWVEVGSVTPRPQEGNPRPRVFHLTQDKAVINRYGFPSKGATSVLTRLQARYASSGTTHSQNASLREGQILSINLGKNKSSPPDSLGDFLVGVRTFGPLADVLVVNVSSPNTPGLRNLQSRGMLIELLDAVKKERDALQIDRELPKVLVKIAPDLSAEELQDVAEAVRETNFDGVIVSNTTIQRPTNLKSFNRKETGGLSGPPLRTLTLKALKTIRPLLPASIPIIGCGGISTGDDALEFARAGATTVQIYTSLAYDGAGAPRRIKDEITQRLKETNLTWMDVVKEGQKGAWKKPREETVPIDTASGLTESIQEGANRLAAMGERLIEVLKEDNLQVADKIQQSIARE
ncbi:hypothetical protein FRC17_005567 [Serendipita sp. 399]|nr:hypothetical protein FRC17_005567 [Serendipita sp. 399]